MYISTRLAGLTLFTCLLGAACGGNGGGSGHDDGGPGPGDDGGGSGVDAGGCGLVTCESAGATCGPVGDGCGGIIQCGDCDAPETCGGGGTASTCGGDSGCIAETCDSVGANCGPIGDGCGGSIDDCGMCDADEICGGQEPSVCSGGGTCVGLCQDQVDCPGNGTTSVSGIVTIPAGTLPLYNITVYVPNAPLDAITTGNTGCEPCDAPLSGSPLVSTTTDVDGHFVLTDMPVGDNIPLVIQSGKWRRKIVIPNVPECVDTPLTAGQTRFPRVQHEGGVVENNIPKIALTTGGLDALECLMRKIGIDDSEFTPEAGSGRVNLYAGVGGTDKYQAGMNGGAGFTNAQTLWDNLNRLDNYDMVVLSCEGAGDDPGNRGAGSWQAMKDYLDDHGGRVFGSHWHHSWVELGPNPFPQVATFTHRPDLPKPWTVNVNTTFSKGAVLSQWLFNVGASTVMGQLELTDGQHTVDSVNPLKGLAWITGTNPNDNDAPGVEYFSFNTPQEIPKKDRCGRMVVTDIHVSAGDDSDSSFAFPDDGCTSTGLLPEEKALIFMLFDLASCVTPDNPMCSPRECSDTGQECGPMADGCGDLVQCGECDPPDTCGGGGTPGQCGNDGCDPIECADVGAECGPIADGCGDTVDCGECDPPDTCGGGGTPNVCGRSVVD